jgi:murein DD-endopeptidase MepM/ murein hydrolase activator NlpD
MQRLLLYLMCIAVLTTACSLTANMPDDDEPIPTTAVSVIITQSVLPTQTPRPTNTTPPQPTNTNPPVVATLPSCSPRTDWGFAYVVVSGDTLLQIALRVNSTTEVLRQGNCLRDANQISVGQVLRVPQNPTPPTVTPTTASQIPEQVGGVAFDEYISSDAEGVHLLRDDDVKIRWVDAPVGLASAEFVLAQQGYPFDPNAKIIQSLGMDTNFSDGVSIPWRVQAGLRGEQVTAVGRFSNSTYVVTSFRLYVSSAPALGQGCNVGPAVGTQDTYAAPDLNAQVTGYLQEGWMVEVMGRSLNGWYGFRTSGGPAVSMSDLRWIPPREGYIYKGNC